MTIRKGLPGRVIVLSLLAHTLGLPWLSVAPAIAAGCRPAGQPGAGGGR